MILLDPLELAQLLLLAVPVVVGRRRPDRDDRLRPGAARRAAQRRARRLPRDRRLRVDPLPDPHRPTARARGTTARIWRNHRLHHFKNEHYWHGITQTLADRVLGTDPDQRDVDRSATARTLDPTPGAPR